MDFVRYTENNDNEGETWTFWLQVEGNEAALERLGNLLAPAVNADVDFPYDLHPDQVLPEEHVDVLVEWGGEGYMPYHHKVFGTLTVPEGFDLDDLYKAGILDLFKQVRHGE